MVGSVLPALKSQSAEAEQKEQQRKQHGRGGCPISSGEYIQLKLVHSSRPVTDGSRAGMQYSVNVEIDKGCMTAHF